MTKPTNSAWWRIALIGLAVGSTLLVGCSGSSSPDSTGTSSGATSASASAPTAQQAIAAVESLVAAATSVAVDSRATQDGATASIVGGGQVDDSSARWVYAGTNGTGEAIVADGGIYLKADDAYWSSHGRSDLSGTGDRYRKVSPDEAAALGVRPVSTLLALFTEDQLTSISSIEVANLNGTPAFKLWDPVDPNEVLWVAADGTGTPLRVEKVGNYTVDFSDWNTVAPVSAPSADQIAG